MKVEFDSQMTPEAMLDYMSYTTYRSLNGILSVLVGVACLGICIKKILDGDMGAGGVFFFIALILLVSNPLTMKTRSIDQVKKTPMFQEPLHYSIEEDGIHISQGEASVVNEWKSFKKICASRKSIFLYLTKQRALIFPKKDLGDQYDEAVEIIKKSMPAGKVKL